MHLEVLWGFTVVCQTLKTGGIIMQKIESIEGVD